MTQRETVYTMLRRAHKDGVTNGAFAEAEILRYSARIEELRREGHAIVKQRVSAKCWKYTLLDTQPTPVVHGVKAQTAPGHKAMSPYEYEREVA